MSRISTDSRPPSPAAAAPPVCVRDRLLEAADRLFYAEGIRAVGIDRILAEAGAAKASLYSHFASKDDLVAAYLLARRDASRAWLMEGVERGGDRPRDRLLALFDRSTEMAATSGFRGCPFQIAAAELPDPTHPASEIVREQRRWVETLIAELVCQVAPAAPAQLARAVVTLYDGAISQLSADASSDALISARWAVEQLLPVRT